MEERTKSAFLNGAAATEGGGVTLSPTTPKICAGIVTYQPDIGRLRENITAVLPQAEKIFIVDNGSADLDRIDELLADFPPGSVERIANGENMGIAHALNQLLEAADGAGYDWILTLDQDSVVMDRLAEEYGKYLDTPQVGMLCCLIVDRNFSGGPARQEEPISRCASASRPGR